MTTPGYQRFFADLKRRRVFRVMTVYGATAFVVIEVADIIFPVIGEQALLEGMVNEIIRGWR